MASFDYNPLAKSIVVKWRCPKCGSENSSDAIAPPYPNMMAETNTESIETDWYDDVCSECEHQVEITMSTGMWSADGEIDVDSENFIGIEEEFEPEQEDFYDPEQYAITKTETELTLDAIENLDGDIKSKLYQLLYANIISKLEAFLCDTIIKFVMKDDERKRHFLQTYEPLANQNFPMKCIYDKYKSLDIIIKRALTSIVYHDLKLVDKLYVNNTGITLNPCKEIKDAIAIRHDIVHRNGKDKEGNSCVISKDTVLELSNKVKDFIDDVDRRVSSVEFSELLKTLNLD